MKHVGEMTPTELAKALAEVVREPGPRRYTSEELAALPHCRDMKASEIAARLRELGVSPMQSPRVPI